MLFHDAKQDRLIDELYAWVCEDKQTGLEGLFGMKVAGLEFQAVTSSPATARRMGETIKMLPYAGKRFLLIRFKKAELLEVIEEVKRD